MTGQDETAARLAAIVASSDDAIISTDVNGIVTTWNAAAERLFGYSVAEIVGQHISAIVPSDRSSEEEHVLARVRAGLQVEHFETVRARKDGSRIEVSLTVSPIRTEAGRIIGTSKISRDISERKTMERHAFRLAAIVESSDDAIVGKDLNGTVHSWNRGAERIFGYAADEMVGRPITVIIPHDRLSEEAHVLSEIRAGSSVKHFETIRQKKDGQLIDVSLTVSPIRTRSGEIIGASKIARDITEEKRLQRAVEHASRAKDEFLATLSHELRTPLNTVLGYTDMLQSGIIAWDDRSKALNAIIRNAEALRQLVNDVLDTSRIVTGNIRLKIESVDIAKVAEEAIETVKPAALAKSIEIRTQISGGLMIQGDPDRLRQVLWNLLSNAVKFTPERGALTVTVGAGARYIRIAVEDTGVRIDPESLPRVFERFWQGDGTYTRVHGGLGLGLALVRHFVELHGGHVTAHSEGRNRGTRFEVTLPTAAVHA